MAYNLILRAFKAPGGSASAHNVLLHYAEFANASEGNKAWPSYAAVAKACHIKCEDTVAAAVEENIRLGYLVPIGNINDKKTWAKKVYPDGKWSYIFQVNPPPLPKHKSQKSAAEDVRKTDTLNNQGAENFGTLKRHKGMQKLPTKTPQGTEKFGTEGTENSGTILGINTTLESLPPTSTLKPSAEGGDITQELVPTMGTRTCTHSGDTNIPFNRPVHPPKPLPSLSAEGGDINPTPKSKEHLKAAAEYVTSDIRRLDRRISQYQEFASRLSGENADNMETIAAQMQMRRSEQTIRLGRIERALQA